jgi:DNA-directed RNA polymerase subunit RPC12/RpoP
VWRKDRIEVISLENNININSKDTHNYPCPGCGGNMIFDPETQALKCPYCESTQDIGVNKIEIKEYDFKTAEDTAPTNWGSEKKVLQCKNCSGEVVMDAVETANSCAFCGSSYIVKNDHTAGIVPESLVPFKISQKKALEMFSKWIKKRYFAPRALKTNYQGQKLTGIYIPNWTYDSDTFSTYSAQVGTYYYVTQTYRENGQTKTRRVRKIRWSYTSGRYSRFFDDVLVNASQKIDEALMNKLQPFHLKELLPYSPKFLSGFVAERYSIGLKEGWGKARIKIDSSLRSEIRARIHGDEVRNLNVSTSYSNIKFKHLLLPIWISSYTYNNKVYHYMVNGQTGEVQGRSPISPIKVTLLVTLILALCAAAYFLYLQYR